MGVNILLNAYLCALNLSVMTAKNTKKVELFRKYATKTEVARLFNYSSANSFLNSSSQKDVLDGCNALIEIIEAKIKAKIDSFKGF